MERKTIGYLAGAIGTVFVLLIVSAWIKSQFDLAKAEATTEAQKNYQDQLSKQIASLADNQKQIAAMVAQIQQEEKQRLDAIDAKFKQAQTPQDVAKLVESIMDFKQPITFTTPPATTENPHPAPIAQISAENTPQVKAYVQACEDCKVSLDSAKKQIEQAGKAAQNFQSQLDLKDLTIDSKDKEIRKWRDAAEGGSKWERFKRALKVIGCATAGGAVGAVAGGREVSGRSTGGAIGAAGGAVVCSVF